MASISLAEELVAGPAPEAANRRLLKAVSAFLQAHHLYPSPDNYALGFAIVTDPDSPMAKAVVDATSDGLRLTQDEADRILAEFRNEPVRNPNPASFADARRQVDTFTSIIDLTREQAASYGRDLERGSAELSALPASSPAVGEIVRITGEMLDRTRNAESQLQAARAEAQSLRAKLAEAEEEARSDPLTRLPNRRAFDDRLAELLQRDGVLSLAICDIDHFKRVNDTHGHGVGDRVLRMVADVLRSSCEGHMVARIGGEEFVVLFEGLEPDAAGSILEEARAELSSRHFKVRGTDAPLGRVTFSAGVAACGTDSEDPPLKRADKLLYRAKHGGRNMVVVEAR